MIRCCTLMLWLTIATPAVAQQARVLVQSGPFFVGEPVVLQVRVAGFEEQPQPQCQFESIPTEVQVQLAGVHPSVSQSIQIINGRRYESRSVVFQINYYVRARQAGTYTLGPFLVTQGGNEARAKSITLTFLDIEEDPDVRVRLVLPSKPIYLGQRVPIEIEFWYAGRENLTSLNIHSPIFDRFTFIDNLDRSRGNRTGSLPIQTKNGTLKLPCTQRVERVDGRHYVVYSAQRILVPERPGEFEFEPITVTARKARYARRRSDILEDFFASFGSNRQDRGIPVRARGRPATLIVRPLPREQRPASFAGAVGPGFTMDVVADRTVVRVGDPITLSITVRGAGNLSNAGLPPLSADGGMDPTKFRLPDGDVTGVSGNGEKQFSVKVRVMRPSVSEIPALAYSWFDPERESYQTTRSKPIALRVMAAQVISADDVVTRAESTASGSPPKHDDAGVVGHNRSPSADAFLARPDLTLSGADLAIESSAPLVLSDSYGTFGSNAWQVSFYVAGLLLIAIAVWDRKRRDVAPEIVRRRKVLRKLRGRIDHARGRPRNEAAEQIANALRGMVAEVPDIPREEVQSILGECESLIYAPGGAGADTVDDTLMKRAVLVADRILKEAE